MLLNALNFFFVSVEWCYSSIFFLSFIRSTKYAAGHAITISWFSFGIMLLYQY